MTTTTSDPRPTASTRRLAGAAAVSRRALAGIALGAIGAVAAAGLYTEAMRAPDQP